MPESRPRPASKAEFGKMAPQVVEPALLHREVTDEDHRPPTTSRLERRRAPTVGCCRLAGPALRKDPRVACHSPDRIAP